jgi:1-acyl-sn-glycerol-3-phosphate acyltransferase
MYVRRNWQADQGRVLQSLHGLRQVPVPTWVAIFPEGTRFDPAGKGALVDQSRLFALERQLPDMRMVLMPRTKGFRLLCAGLRGHATAVYDVSIAYTRRGEDARPAAPGLADLMSRRYGDVHVHVRRYDMATVPTDPNLQSQWLIGRFKDKDRLLERFYAGHGFPGDSWSAPMTPAAAVVRLGLAACLIAPCLLTATGGRLYARVWVLGAIGGILVNAARLALGR